MCASAITITSDKINCPDSYILIWLNGANCNSPSSQHEMQEELQDTINCQKTFDDFDACRKFIRENNCEYVIIVSNETFAEKLVWMMKHEEKIRTIYIYYEDEKSKSELSAFQKNIVLISTDELVEKIKIDQRRRQRYEDPISFNCMTGNRFNDDGSSSMYSFMTIELLLDVILRTEQPNEMYELIRLCKIEYHNNEVEKRRIDLFQQTYTAETSIRWFTKDSFVYRLLNKALRLQNIEILLVFRFFIKDLHEQLAKLEKDRNISNMKVFRGQILPSTDLERMKRSIGKLISFHSFISASLIQDLAINFIVSEPPHPHLVNVLFEIECDQCSSLSLTPKPYADVSELSEIPTEEEVLFSLG